MAACGELEAEALALELLGDPLDHEVDDLVTSALDSSWKTMVSSMRFRNSGRKCCLERVVDLLLHLLVGDRLVGLARSRRWPCADPAVPRLDVMISTVLRKSTERPWRVGEATLLEDLQQRVEHVGVGLLDLVEQHHRERLAPHGLGELAALFVADVAGGRADQAADGVLLHVLGHVELRSATARRRTGTRRASWRARSCRRPTGPGR